MTEQEPLTRCFVLTWEPRKDPGFLTDEEWDSLADDSARVEREGDEPLMAWPVPDGWTDACVGDRVFVFRQAVSGNGVVAVGDVQSEPYMDWGRAVVDLSMRCVPLAAALPFESIERESPSIPWRLLDADEVHEIAGPERQRLNALWSRRVGG